MTKAEARAYLAGLIDGEGSIDDGTGRSRKRCVRISNTDPDIIAAACCALELLGISYHTSTYQPKRHVRCLRCTEITISHREGVEQIAATLPLQSGRKKRRLEVALAGYCYVRRPPVEELRRLYVDEQLSLAQLGARCGISAPTAHAWLVRAGIPRRSISDALRLARG